MTKIKMLGMAALTLAMAVLFIGCAKNNSRDTKPQEPAAPEAGEAAAAPEETPLEASGFLGWWENVNDGTRYYYFGEDNRYSSGRKETSMITEGTWQIKGTVISLEFEVYDMADDSTANYTVDVAVNVIDKDTLELTFPESGTVKVKRVDSPAGSSSSDASWSKALDDYERFVDEYVVFMKKYQANPNDMTMLTQYASMLEKLQEAADSIEKVQGSLSEADLASFMVRYSKITAKLASML